MPSWQVPPRVQTLHSTNQSPAVVPILPTSGRHDDGFLRGSGLAWGPVCPCDSRAVVPAEGRGVGPAKEPHVAQKR
eukprot:3019312-Rhodomonas_salina.2